MKIAVNTRFLLSDYIEGMGYFIQEIFKRIVKQHPEHEFLFIFDRPYDHRFVFDKNVTAMVAGPPARHPLLWKWWYDVKVPLILKKHKADIFISCDGFCSLNTNVPQCMVVHDLPFLHYPAFSKRSHVLYYKHYTPAFLQKAKRIVTVSEFSKTDIISHYKTDPGKIDIVHNGVKDVFHPISITEKEQVQEKYTAGKNYLLYTGSIHPRKNLTNLLRAFSIFKKRQQSNWKLVLAGRLAWKYEHFTKSLASYKYRDDVMLTGYLEETELAKLTASAYALVYPSVWEGFGVPVLEAMKSHVPVITSANSSMQEIAGDAALYFDPSDHADMANKIMLLYKDEPLRSRLIEKGKEKVQAYNWDRSAELFWKSIMKCKMQNSRI
jgi:glycosyltransferase involved in cell wall biosynthesis